ncbi:MAG TPA: ATP-binding cassette domain-containing protein [Acidimicrobiales bacterium]|nr:ATP-binding cassette domain-containing protein [Acidimicrobiales bacterium]
MTVDQRLKVECLRSGYLDIEILHGIDLEVAAGEVVALFGPNGAGKTTLLLTVAGLLLPMDGQIVWDGDSTWVAPHKLARRGITFVPERGVLQQLTVEGNLQLGRGRPEDALEIFPELVPLLRRRAGLLSGGEQQMLSVGRALASKPKVLLIDELSLGLAPIIVVRLLNAVRKAADTGIGVLLVEQQVERALSVADRGYVLNRGHITFAGSQADLRSHAETIAGEYLATSS